MCLRYSSLPKYSGNKEIICYKVLNQDCTSLYKYFPYYFHKLYNTKISFDIFSTEYRRRNFKLSIGSIRYLLFIKYELVEDGYFKTYHENSFVNNLIECCKYYEIKDYQMIREGFYSFKEFEHAKLNCNSTKKNIIVECHIPKYTWYYEGLDTCGFPAYVSESIVIDKIINS